MRLVFIAYLVKVMLAFRPDSPLKREEIHPEEEKTVLRLAKQVSQFAGTADVISIAKGKSSALNLAQSVKSR